MIALADVEVLVVFTVLGFLAVLGLITGLLAQRKGYKFAPWFLAGGTLGLVVLAFLPFANAPELSALEQQDKTDKGNTIGRNLAIVSLVLVLLRLLASS
ncbi:MAG TPA: hypothetical protein VF600_12480 [Abditibacteriaceae bacterium]|jgi:MFS family permease